MRKALIAISCIAGLLGMPASHALPHGCVSISNDYSLGFDVLSRSLIARVNADEPCTFRFAAGDTYSGSGRFTVSCATGGRVDHPDFQGGAYPPVFGVLIPTPCAVGALVTVDAHHAGTGGAALAGSGM